MLAMTVREAIQMVQAEGWYPVKSKGGHRQFKHPTKAGRVTIPGKPGKELPPGTLASIKRQAGLK